ncbi:MAG: response regulator, partial [Anaerolineales bacterium]
MKPGIILVVDDEFGIREGCRRALEPEGHEVHLVESVSSARATLETNRFDLVLLDVMMPDGRGMDLIADIHASYPDTVAIIITGYATVELAVEAIQRGAYDFIAKPFSADVLLLAVEQGLEHRRLSQEARGYHQAQARSERLQMEKEEMERLDAYKTEFTRLVAHELRSPVSALISFLRTMAKGYVPAEQQAEILE